MAMVDHDKEPAGMGAFWDAKARENPMYFIHSELDYRSTDEAEFWASGERSLEKTLAPFGLEIGPADRVVEIGCGIGRLTRPLARRARRVVGVDVSPGMVRKARQALADLDNVELLVGNGSDLSALPDGSADIVYSFIVFQHIPDPTITCNYVREIGRVLRTGGWTVFQVSERPEVHRPSPVDLGMRSALRRAAGRQPKGRTDPAWLGSAVPRPMLLQAICDGGLELRATVGDATQYCMVHAAKPPAPGGARPPGGGEARPPAEGDVTPTAGEGPGTAGERVSS